MEEMSNLLLLLSLIIAARCITCYNVLGKVILMTYKCASFFAGVGGIDLGFEKGGNFETVYANEFDKYPAITFESNFDIKVDVRDISTVNGNEIPDVDVIMGGFPCQAFSIAGYRQGFEDVRGRGMLFFELARIVECKKPRVVFLENVKNLVSHDEGKTFKTIIDTLEDIGYKNPVYGVLNAMDYGNIPQNRERIYIVAFRDETDRANFHMPNPIRRDKTLKDIIDFNNKVNDKYYYTEGKYKGDIYNALVDAMDDSDSIYQWRRKYVRKNQSHVVPTLTANMGEGGHNVPLVLTKTGIRKLTPKECFRAQGFPDDFKLPEEMNDSKLYKQAGNSVCVSVIERIANNIQEALLMTDAFNENRTDKIDVGWLEKYARNLEPRSRNIIIDMLNQWRAQ